MPDSLHSDSRLGSSTSVSHSSAWNVSPAAMAQVTPQAKVMSISVNDDGNLFAVCTDTSVRLYGTSPLVGKLFLDSSIVGSVSHCALLARTNLIALVGGAGPHPKFADNAVLVWDDASKRFVLEITLHSAVLGMRLRRDCLLVAERNCIHSFSLPHQPRLQFTVSTRDNPLGMFQVTPLTCTTELSLLVYPGHVVGTVQLLDFSRNTSSAARSSKAGSNLSAEAATSSISPTTVSAHQTEIACLALNSTGSLMATASQKGTLIRIFRTVSSLGGAMRDNGQAGEGDAYVPLSPVKIGEFRRGLDAAQVYCIVFSPNSEFVMASSDKGTVHIFALKETRLNRRSTFSSVPFMNVDSLSSLAKFTVPAECACLCAYGPDHQSVYAICVDGTFHKYRFSQDGTCVREFCGNYLDVPEESDHILF